jgi:hypothetical protein
MGAFTLGKERLRDGIMLAIALWAWPAAGWAYTGDQEQACTGDAFRLCSSEIPDVPRVTACMVRRQAELSPGCRIYFRPERAPEHIAAKPQTSHKPRKPHKPHKRAHSPG